jgi:hypothetical protein
MTTPEQAGAKTLIPPKTAGWKAKSAECNATNRFKLGKCVLCTMTTFTPQNFQNFGLVCNCTAALPGPGTTMQPTTPAQATAGCMGTALWDCPHRDMHARLGSHSTGQKFEQTRHVSVDHSQTEHPIVMCIHVPHPLMNALYSHAHQTSTHMG